MRILVLAAALAVCGVAAAQYQNVNAKCVATLQYGQPSSGVSGADFMAYDNKTNYTGQAYFNAFAGPDPLNPLNIATGMVMDDISCAPATAGLPLNLIYLTTYNANAVNESVRFRVRFWQMNGAGGGPGTFITGYSTGLVTLNAGAANIWSLTITPVPLWGQNFWAGLTFDNNAGGSPITAAELNNLGQLLFNPPVVGTSQDAFFSTQTPWTGFGVNNPPGGIFWFGGNPVANFGWGFQVTPEPGTVAAIAAGLLGLLGLRRRK